jgi:YesN/AraC family two-component response regulator
MKTIKAILVDDEHSSITALSNLLQRFCPDVEIVATAN